MSKIIDKFEVNYMNEKYILKEYNYDIQYFPYYNSRHELMSPFLIESIGRKWGKELSQCVLTLRQLAEREDELIGETVVIVGTTFKHCINQPSILQEVSEDNPVLDKPVDEYTSDEDSLYLQSGDATILLSGVDVHKYCTGICLAAKGREDDRRSTFIVEDVCFAQNFTEPIDIDRALTPKDQYIALASGLGFSKFMKSNQNLTKALNLFMDILTGNSSFAETKPISRLIIAGNGIGIDARKQESDSLLDEKLPLWTQKVRAQTVQAIRLYDKFLSRIGQYIEVDVMPGVLDPTFQLLPQQPLNPCAFKKSFEMSSIKCVPNPHSAQYNGIEMLGTSGQNIDSIRDYTQMKDPIEIMRRTLEWYHIAPTAPDNLQCYPFKDTDPFVLSGYPDVYFVGNQNDFNSGTFSAPNGKQVLLISVPTFEQKMVFVVLNLRTLKCDLIALN